MTDQNIYDDHKQDGEISPARKQTFYFGMGVSFLGVVLIAVGFIGFVVSGFSNVNGSGSADTDVILAAVHGYEDFIKCSGR